METTWKHRLLIDTDIEIIQFDLNKYSSSTKSKKEIGKKNNAIQQETVVAQGCVPITKHDILRYNRTLINYQALIADNDILSITTHIMLEKRTRYTAGNSWIPVMDLVCVVAATRYDLATDIQSEYEHIIHEVLLEIIYRVKCVYRMVDRVYGNGAPMLFVRPRMILSIDDTV